MLMPRPVIKAFGYLASLRTRVGLFSPPKQTLTMPAFPLTDIGSPILRHNPDAMNSMSLLFPRRELPFRFLPKARSYHAGIPPGISSYMPLWIGSSWPCRSPLLPHSKQGRHARYSQFPRVRKSRLHLTENDYWSARRSAKPPSL